MSLRRSRSILAGGAFVVLLASLAVPCFDVVGKEVNAWMQPTIMLSFSSAPSISCNVQPSTETSSRNYQRHIARRRCQTMTHLLASTTSTFSLVSINSDDSNDNDNDDDDVDDDQNSFEFDEKAIRMTYDAWRPFYNKGDFDVQRYEIFKQNYKTLTIANIKARNQAAAEKKPIPPWMQLNQYADLSLDEYNKLKNEEHDDGSKSGTTTLSLTAQRQAGLSSLKQKQLEQRNNGDSGIPLWFEQKPRQDLKVIESKQKSVALLSSSSTTTCTVQFFDKIPPQFKGPTIITLRDVEVEKIVENANERLFLY